MGMIGDGINDARHWQVPASGSGSAVPGPISLETADVVLMADDLRRLPYAIALARKSQQIVRQNLILWHDGNAALADVRHRPPAACGGPGA